MEKLIVITVKGTPSTLWWCRKYLQALRRYLNLLFALLSHWNWLHLGSVKVGTWNCRKFIVIWLSTSLCHYVIIVYFYDLQPPIFIRTKYDQLTDWLTLLPDGESGRVSGPSGNTMGCGHYMTRTNNRTSTSTTIVVQHQDLPWPRTTCSGRSSNDPLPLDLGFATC